MSDSSAVPNGRIAGAVLFVAAILSVVLLMNHPGGHATTFADILKDEASNQAKDMLVHGGFIFVLAAEFACLAIMTARMTAARAAAIAGLALFAMAATFMSLSMVLDGLVTPAIAARYLGAPAEKYDLAKALFVLVGTLIRFLMPLAQTFQALAVGLWGLALLRISGLARGVGMLGVALGVLLTAALLLPATSGNPVVLMAAIATLSLWYGLAGAVLFLGRI